MSAAELQPHIEYLKTPDGVRIALHRLGNRDRPRVLLIPGTFSNSTFWFGTRGVGFARTLADAGYEACVLDPRGHGESDRPTRDQHWDIDDWARLDVPTALLAVASVAKPVLVVAHSAGGAVTLAALSAEPDLRDFVKGVVALGTPLPWLQPWRGALAWLIRVSSLLLGRFPARLLRIGPEDELPRVMAQWMNWNLLRHIPSDDYGGMVSRIFAHGKHLPPTADGFWLGDDGTNYGAGLKQLDMPFLMIAAAGDKLFAPPEACRGLFDEVGSSGKEFWLAGRSTGYSKDFGHTDVVTSKAARVELWPKIISWLDSRI